MSDKRAAYEGGIQHPGMKHPVLGTCEWDGCERDAFHVVELGVDTTLSYVLCGPHAERVKDGDHQLEP